MSSRQAGRAATYRNYASASTHNRGPQHQPMSSRPQTPPLFENSTDAAGPAPEELWQRMEDVDDEVVTLSKMYSVLQQKVQKLEDAQEHGCHRAADMFSQVCSLLSTTGSLNEKIKDLEGASRSSVVMELDRHREETRAEQKRFEDAIKKLLGNFRAEITAVAREGESRHSVLQKHLEQLQDRVTDIVAAQRQVREDHTRLTSAVDVVERKLQEATQAMESGLQQTGDATTQKLDSWGKAVVQRVEAERKSRHELAAAVQDLSGELERVGQLVSSCDGLVKSAGDRAQEALMDSRRELSQHLARLDGAAAAQQSLLQQTSERLAEVEKRAALADSSISRLCSSADALAQGKAVLEQTCASSQTSLTTLQEALRKLEADSEKRHRKLVESTRTALAEVAKSTDGMPGVLSAVQQELTSVRETLHTHHVAIEAQRLDGTLDSAFAEVKDWLQDLERRSMSRTEIEESLLNIQTQLTALRHAAHTNDAMAQRTEDFSHLSGRQTTRR
jgi:chromosome segregation ATPase